MGIEEKEIQVSFADLADFTARPQDRDQAIPSVWQDWIEREFPEVEQRRTPPKLPPPGTLGMLVSGTNWVVKMRPFVWQLLKLGVTAWVLSETQFKSNAAKVASAIAITEIMSKMKDTILQLDQNKGEHCTYLAIAKRVKKNQVPGSNVLQGLEMIWAKHQHLNQACPVTTCKFHWNGCTLSRDDLASVLSNLEKHKVIRKTDQNLWKTVL